MMLSQVEIRKLFVESAIWPGSKTDMNQLNADVGNGALID